MGRSMGWRVNEMILVILILFQVLDFFKLLDPFWDYIKKIISWSLIGYLLYLTSPSGIFFGERHRWWDAAAILSFFSMTVKNLVGFAVAARERMLEQVGQYAAFMKSAAVTEGIDVTLNQTDFMTFMATPFLNGGSTIAKPFAGQLTMADPAIRFVFSSGNESIGALLQPYGQNGMVFQLYNTLVHNAAAIEQAAFIAGAVAVILLVLIAAFRFRVQERSVLQVIHEGGPLKDAGHAAMRVVSVFLVTSAYFILFFNLLSEWLAIAIDAPLAMAGIAIYLFAAFRFHRLTHRNVETDDLLTRIGGFGNDFVKSFAGLFTEKRTVFLGLSGLLVLHLLTDIGTFVIPYITGLQDPLYFGHLGPGHEPLTTLIAAAWGGPERVAVLLLYILNAVGIVALLGLPAYIWYKTFRIRNAEKEGHRHHPQLPGWSIAVLLSGIGGFLAAPAFRMTSITGSTIIGVDLQTMPIAAAEPAVVAALILGGAIIVLALSFLRRIREYLMAALFVTSLIFLGVYSYHFFMATCIYYIREGWTMLIAGTATSLFIAAWLFLFFTINILFYAFGFFGFLYETLRE